MKGKKISLLLFTFALAQAAMAQCSCGACSNPVGLVSSADNNMTPIPRHGLQAELVSDWRKFNQVSSVIMESAGTTQLENETVATLAVRYGITQRFTVSALQPYAALKSVTGDRHDGFTDLTVLAGYTAVNKASFRVSVTGGVKLPTASASTGLQTPVVFGSGTYDPAIGASIVSKKKNVIIAGNAFYKHATENRDQTSFGDLFTHSLTVIYKKAQEDTLGKDSQWVFSFALGATGEWEAAQSRAHVILVPGGYTASAVSSVVPGIDRWSFPLSVEVPVLRTGEGHQAFAYRIRLGVIYSLTL